MSTFAHTEEATDVIGAPIADVFEFLDDQANLSAHMSEPSAMMFGTTMTISMEEDHTRSVGSRFGFEGRVLGLPLRVQEIVSARNPPDSKSWETTNEPVLWVMGRYSMSFDLSPHANGSSMRVRITYDDPQSPFPRFLGLLFGRLYAKWCVSQMIRDTRKHFARPNVKTV